ncbi:uncharacterized protein LOC114323085 isoform X1 [Camellia sinensis]|uniref:uncharacterized protein LOC114323085 isoform X1 n=1 Tax=Camellia sinensis TaxID=4442 RepID=UPI001036124C|nr:uncharacterized protein LOC114323085 isoform X1 [Camellia sinensis]
MGGSNVVDGVGYLGFWSSGHQNRVRPLPFQKKNTNFFHTEGGGGGVGGGGDKRLKIKQQHRQQQHTVPSLRRTVSNGYVGTGRNNYMKSSNNNNSSRIYERLESCLVIPPPTGKKPRAIVKFLGGAFIGAVPEVTYSYLLELLANEGYLIISVPYNVTFDHAEAAREIYERFIACLDRISTSGLPSANLTATELFNLPLYSVGHSNGALLQLLTGSYFSEKIAKANAIISFNNRPATEAVPYFEQLGPLVSQMVPVVESSPIYSMARNVSGDAWKTLLDMAAMIPDYDQEAVVSLTKFVDQLPSVLNQVRQGISEFKPTPSENRDCFKNSYNVEHTLLVKFNFDTIDETDLLEETLKPRVESIGGTLEKVLLTGNHVTPCVQVIAVEIVKVWVKKPRLNSHWEEAKMQIHNQRDELKQKSNKLCLGREIQRSRWLAGT